MEVLRSRIGLCAFFDNFQSLAMNTLQGYGSDSDGEGAGSSSQAGPSRPAAVPAKKKRTEEPETAEEQNDDEDDEEVSPDDVFGLGHLRKDVSDKSQVEKNGAHLVKSAPDVLANVDEASTALLTRPTDTEMHVNIPFRDLARPLAGPQNPFSNKVLGSQQNNLSGHVEQAAMTDFDFRNQQRTFETLGYAKNPSQYAGGNGSEWVGDVQEAQRLGGASAVELRGGGSAEARSLARQTKRKRKGQDGDLSVIEGEGAYVGPWGGWEGERVQTEPVGPSEEELKAAEERSSDRKRQEAEMKELRQREAEQGTEKSVFHGEHIHLPLCRRPIADSLALFF